MARNILHCISNGCALLLIPFLIHVRDVAGEAVAMSKYRELTTLSAVTEDPIAVAKITGRTNDWAAVPQFVFGRRDWLDAGVLVMLAPVFISFVISLADLVTGATRRRNGSSISENPKV